VDTVFRHIHLVPPYAGDGSKDLAVDIRQADTVVVYDIYGSHTAAGQYLNDIATNASHAKDSDTGAVERVYSRLAQQ
jgi:hypothetical protein